MNIIPFPRPEKQLDLQDIERRLLGPRKGGLKAANDNEKEGDSRG